MSDQGKPEQIEIEHSRMPQMEPWKAYGTLALLSLVWGASFVLIKRGLDSFDNIEVAFIRISISGLAFLPLLIAQWKKIDWSYWKPFLVVGLSGTAIPAFLFATAQTEISSSVTGILNSLVPLFTFVLGILFFGGKFAWVRLIGVLLGLSGAVLLILLGNQAGMQGNMWYAGLVVLATVCYATSSNTVATYLQGVSSLLISCVSFAMVGLPGVILLLTTTNFVHDLQTVPGAWESLGYLAILALVGTVSASILFFKLVQSTSALFASSVTYLVPIVAIFWGFLDGEPITWMHFLAMGVVLLGVYLSRKAEKG